MRKEKRVTGLSIVPGKGVGKAYFVGRATQQTSLVSISRQDVGDQIMRFNEIRERAKEEYRKYAESINGAGTFDASILNIYEHILDDPAFIGQVVETITTKLFDLETSIRLVSNDFIKRFSAAGTSYFKERVSDMVEVCEKLVSYINLDEGRTRTFLEPIVLVVLRTFTPSDILRHDIDKMQAIVSASGGKTSHAAILARSYGIPVVSGIRGISEVIRPGDQLYVDADRATVFIRPPASMVARYEREKPPREEINRLKKKWKRPAYTRDGIAIEVMSNVSLVNDVDTANEFGADGVGLVRSEYLLANRKEFPSEDEQGSFYESIFKKIGSKHCVVRMMDIGGDKTPDFLKMPSEFNPFMGWRAIRILLERQDLFEIQLRAAMRAGQKANYSIMLPMVTTLQEWLDAKAVISGVAKKLGVKTPPCGVLFEVPLAVLEMGSFMREIDFASIGTNDLLQYLSAADRNNPKVNYLYNPIEPAFLKILRSAIDTSKDHGKPLSICGEMAGDPFHTALLVGFGLKRFSVNPRTIPIIKELISTISFAEAAEATSHIEALDSPDETERWVKRINRRLVGDVLQKLPLPSDF
ncbi:MAG: phosphoenolpyruvate--protein phosphotransferase [Chitinivibrionales bacterium]|nr:phosphoenolpyruvate--protein phosphotransferase [Chitinivibrionales bacterium]MBD3396015.1 phosphoenolpyruvate--protein phosphotransferase [Chitinivibrionales bacterium]